jgi:hypothetical protein
MNKLSVSIAVLLIGSVGGIWASDTDDLTDTLRCKSTDATTVTSLPVVPDPLPEPTLAELWIRIVSTTNPTIKLGLLWAVAGHPETHFDSLVSADRGLLEMAQPSIPDAYFIKAIRARTPNLDELVDGARYLASTQRQPLAILAYAKAVELYSEVFFRMSITPGVKPDALATMKGNIAVTAEELRRLVAS